MTYLFFSPAQLAKSEAEKAELQQKLGENQASQQQIARPSGSNWSICKEMGLDGSEKAKYNAIVVSLSYSPIFCLLKLPLYQNSARQLFYMSGMDVMTPWNEQPIDKRATYQEAVSQQLKIYKKNLHPSPDAQPAPYPQTLHC
jgi:hypothetical protein